MKKSTKDSITEITLTLSVIGVLTSACLLLHRIMSQFVRNIDVRKAGGMEIYTALFRKGYEEKIIWSLWEIWIINTMRI